MAPRPRRAFLGTRMKLKVFTLRLDPDTGEFDEGELRTFVEAHEVLAVQEHMLAVEGRPAWAILVSFRDRAKPGVARPPSMERDAALEVPEADRGLFEVLRRWRNERAKRDGRPTYIVFTNRQLADIARVQPKTLAALHEVNGVGESKLREYGPDVLALIGAQAASDGPPPDAANPVGSTDG